MGDMPRLSKALDVGLDAGLAVDEIKEILVQLYAYAGFPRSLNALAELMKTLDARKQRGLHDATGRTPNRPIPQGEALWEAGTANQTKLSGSPVRGALFDFAPAVAQYLKTHLFGDIFERDNFDWQSRELATVGMLSALQGVDAQLQAHLRISMNVGLTVGQLRQLSRVLGEHFNAAAEQRVREALMRHLATIENRCRVRSLPHFEVGEQQRTPGPLLWAVGDSASVRHP
jgi:alkylhydroperoxidase/carboxymuconolactone decarboxylase family protein YurZ